MTCLALSAPSSTTSCYYQHFLDPRFPEKQEYVNLNCAPHTNQRSFGDGRARKKDFLLFWVPDSVAIPSQGQAFRLPWLPTIVSLSESFPKCCPASYASFSVIFAVSAKSIPEAGELKMPLEWFPLEEEV